MCGAMKEEAELSLADIFQTMLRRRVWKQDIHPSARIARSAHIDRTWPKGIHIGKDAIIEEQAVVLAHDMSRGIYLDTRIADGARVGIRAIIMPGITIGSGAVVEPGAVVTRDVKPGQTVRGNPARPVKE